MIQCLTCHLKRQSTLDRKVVDLFPFKEVMKDQKSEREMFIQCSKCNTIFLALIEEYII
jgi:hypothetical protein